MMVVVLQLDRVFLNFADFVSSLLSRRRTDLRNIAKLLFSKVIITVVIIIT